MTTRGLLVVLFLGLAVGFAVAAPTLPAFPVSAAVDKHIANLVTQLGDEDFPTREAAERRLRAMGLVALSGLVKGLRDERPEVVRRASGLIKQLRPKAMPLVRELKTEPRIAFRSIKFSRDGKHIAACGEFGVHVWDVETGRTVNRIDLKDYIHRSVEFTPDGKGLWIGGSGGIIRLDIATGKSTWVVQEQHSYYAHLLLTPDAKYLLAPHGQQLVVFDAATEKQKHTVKITPFSISDIKLSPDGKTVALGCTRRGVAIVDHLEGELIRTWQLPAPRPLRDSDDQRVQVQCVAWAPDGKSLACGLSGTETGGRIFLYTPEGKVIREWQAHTYGVRQLAFTDGQLLISTGGGGTNGLEDVLSVGNPVVGKACLRLNLREESVLRLAVREDLGLFALVGRGTIRIRRLPHQAWASAPFLAD